MSGSLQDQLLNAGLIQKQKAKNIKTAKKKAVKQSRANKTTLVDEAAELAKKAQEDQRRKSQQLNEQRKREAEQKAILAQIRQIIQLNSIEAFKKSEVENTQTYNFTDNNKIKTIQVTAEKHKLLSNGRLAIAKLLDNNETNYHLIPVDAANKIIERDKSSIVLLIDKAETEDGSIDDDPYADYQIPDDLMW